jgi:hypothetical protein
VQAATKAKQAKKKSAKNKASPKKSPAKKKTPKNKASPKKSPTKKKTPKKMASAKKSPAKKKTPKKMALPKKSPAKKKTPKKKSSQKKSPGKKKQKKTKAPEPPNQVTISLIFLKFTFGNCFSFFFSSKLISPFLTEIFYNFFVIEIDQRQLTAHQVKQKSIFSMRSLIHL